MHFGNVINLVSWYLSGLGSMIIGCTALAMLSAAPFMVRRIIDSR